MTTDRISVTASITRYTLIEAVISAINDARDFDHRDWPLWYADLLESAARRIREGYAGAEREKEGQAP